MMLSSAWVCLTSSCLGGIKYIPLLNNSIADKAVAIQPDNLACHAGRLRWEAKLPLPPQERERCCWGSSLSEVCVHTHLASFVPGNEVESMFLTQSCHLSLPFSLMDAQTSTHTWSCTRIYTHIHTCKHTLTCARTHTHTHTHVQNMPVGLQENSTVQATANHWFCGSVVL